MPSSIVPPAVTPTIPAVSDAASALTTPTCQVHTTHVTPSTGGSTSAQMNSGPPTLLHQMMSSASAQSQPAAPDGSITTTFSGHQYNVHRINHTSYQYSYNIHENCIQSTHGALVDSGVNGSMAGPDTYVLSIVPNAHVDITGISRSPIEQLPLVQCATLVHTLDEGQVILIMSQYAHLPKGKTIHSKSQLEYFGCSVHDSALRTGGKQCIYTPEGYVIPLHVHHGLFCMDMQPPTDADLHNFPHVFLTANSL